MPGAASSTCRPASRRWCAATPALVIAGREALLARLAAVAKKLEGTKFAFSEHNDYVEATCPWGNKVRVYEPDAARFGRISLGIPYVEFDVPVGSAKAIAAFYPAVFGTPASVQNGDGTRRAHADGQEPVSAIPRDRRAAARVRRPSRADVHHGFLRAVRRLKERNLISLEDNQYQYRFQDIVDLDSGKPLFTVEHEVRSFTHPMCLRPLVNRNPATNNRNYANGYDSSLWAMGPDEYDTVDMRPR